MVLAFCFTNFVFRYIISLFLAYFAMEYLCYVSMTPFFFEANCCFLKRKKKGGGGNVRSLRLKNWLPLESTIIYKVVRS